MYSTLKSTHWKLREGVKKMYRGYVPYRGGGDPPPAKKVFFSSKIKKKFHHALINFFVKTIFL